MSALPVVGAKLALTGQREWASGFKAAGGAVGEFAAFSQTRFRAIGAGMAILGGTILVAARAFAAGAADFEKEMRNIQTISVEAQKDLTGFGDKIHEVASRTNQSATEAAQGMYQIVSSGFDGSAALQVLEASSIAASAGLTDVFTSASAVASVLNAYGKSGAEAEQISDILFQTVNLGVGTFEELAGSVGQVVGLASQAKVEFGEVSAAIAATSRSGISFDEAATGVNRIIQEMLDPTDQLLELLNELGYESGAAALAQDGLYGVLEKIRGKVGDNSAAYVTMFGRIEATRTALALGADDGDNFAEAMASIADDSKSAGAATRAYKIQQESLNAKTKDLQNTIESLGTSALLPVLVILNKSEGALKKFLDIIDKLPAPIKAGIGVATIFAGVILTLLGAAFIALPRLILVAAFAMIRYNAQVREAIAMALQLASANSVLAASARQVFNFLTDANLVTGIAKGIGKWSLLIGVMTAAITQLATQSAKTEEIVARLGQAATNEEVTNFVKRFAEDLEELEKASKWGQAGGPGQAIDMLFGTELDMSTRVKKARSAFAELARTNREAAVRIIESAEASGKYGEAVEFMKSELEKADKAVKDTDSSVASLTETFTTSSGQMILVSEDVKDALESFRDEANEMRSGFGDLFADPRADAEALAEAVENANKSVKDAERDLADARTDRAKASEDASKRENRAQREVAKARADLAALERQRPRRNRGESREEFQIRVAADLEEARQRVADAEDNVSTARDNVGDATSRIAELEEKLVEAREREKDAVDAQVVSGHQLLDNLREQGRVLSDLFTNFANLRARGFTEPMMKELRDLGPQGAAQVAALTKLTDDELKEYRRVWQENSALASGIALNPNEKNPAAIQAKLNELWEQTGGNAAQFMQLGAAAGTTALEAFLTGKFQSLGEKASQELYNALPPEIQTKIKLKIEATDPATAATLSALTGGALDFQNGTLNLRSASEQASTRDPNSFAKGGIFNQPTYGLFGEAGAEAIIPLTNPARAMELMQKSGLLAMARRSMPMFAAGGIIGARSLPGYQMDRSTHLGYNYGGVTVVANDPAEFGRKMRQRQRVHALQGLDSGR